MSRLATLFTYCTMPFGWEHLRIGYPEVTVADRSFAIIGRERLPQALARLGRAVAKSQPNNAPGLPFQGDPDPHHVAFACYKGAHSSSSRIGRSANGRMVSPIGVRTFFKNRHDGGAAHAQRAGNRTLG